MALQNITPQYQAEEKTAQFRLRPVPIHNGLYETGKMLTDAGQGLQKGAFSLTLGLKQRNDRLQAEEDEFALADKLNYVTSEATKYVANFKKLGGMATEGGTQKYDAFMDGLLAKGQEGLSPRAARMFGNRFASLRLSLWNTVQGHEYSNTKSATLQSINGQIENLGATFRLTRDPAVLAQIRDAYNQLWEAQTGMRLPDSITGDWGNRHNPETDQMDGPKKNAGWVGIHMNREGQVITELSRGFKIDGKEVEAPMLNPYTADNFARIIDGDITEEDEALTRKWAEDRLAQGKSPFYDGDPDDESLRKLGPSQMALETNLRLYQQGWQNIFDKAVGGLFDEFTAEGDLKGMNQLFGNSEAVFGFDISDKEKIRMKQVIEQKTTEQVNEAMAQDYLLDINAAGGDYAEGGRYNTPEQDARFAEIISMLESSGNKDDQIVADRLKTLRKVQVLAQESNLGAALSQYTADLFHGDSVTEWEKDLWTLKSRIDSMPYNLVKDTLEQFYQNNAKKLDARYAATHEQMLKESVAVTAAEQKMKEDNAKAEVARAKTHAASREHKMYVARLEDEVCAKSHSSQSGYLYGKEQWAIFEYRKNGEIVPEVLSGYLNYNSYELGGELLPEERERIYRLATDPIAVTQREDAITRVTNVMSNLINKGQPEARKVTLDRNTISLAMPDLVNYVIDMQREWTGAGEVKMDVIAPKLNQAIIDYVSTKGNAGVLWKYILGKGFSRETGRVDWRQYNETNFRGQGIPKNSIMMQSILNMEQDTKPRSTDRADILVNNIMLTTPEEE